MKALAITHKGLEQVTSLEISELLKIKTEIKDSCVIFDVASYEDIALVCYKSQSVKKVLLLLDNFKINSLKDIKKSVKKNIKEIEEFVKPQKTKFSEAPGIPDSQVGKTFAVSAEHLENDFDTEEICIEAAASITAKVDLKNPDVILFVYIFKNDCYLGIDFSGEDLSKRDYRIYTHYQALRASIAYSLLRIADYSSKDIILDPFCGSGTILIEAALFANNFSQNYYSKDKFAFNKFLDIDLEKLDKKSSFKGSIMGFDNELRYIIGAKKNAKIAGIEKLINLSKIDIEWLETKLKEKSIDKIITNPPNLSNKNQRTIEKIYDEFFNQADFLLKDKGNVTLITKTFDIIKNSAEKYNFKPIKEFSVVIGKEEHKIIVFSKI